jgi:hypothetical protein
MAPSKPSAPASFQSPAGPLIFTGSLMMRPCSMRSGSSSVLKSTCFNFGTFTSCEIASSAGPGPRWPSASEARPTSVNVCFKSFGDWPAPEKSSFVLSVPASRFLAGVHAESSASAFTESTTALIAYPGLRVSVRSNFACPLTVPP